MSSRENAAGSIDLDGFPGKPALTGFRQQISYAYPPVFSFSEIKIIRIPIRNPHWIIDADNDII